MSRTKEELERAAAERDSEALAEIKAQAQAVESKTSRLKSLRLAKEAADKPAEERGPTQEAVIPPIIAMPATMAQKRQPSVE